jgi:hypothetical protein
MIIMLSRSYDNPLLWTICHMWSGECNSIMLKMFQSCQTVCISLNHREVHSVHSKWVTMIIMLSRRYDNPLLWTICHVWSGECYSIMFMFQSCQTVCISLNHKEVHSVLTFKMSHHDNHAQQKLWYNLLLWTICHMWSGECYSIMMFMFQSCQTVCISLNHREVHSVHSKSVNMIIMLIRSYYKIRCCGQSVTCGVENVTASWYLCFRVVKLFVSHYTTEKFIQFWHSKWVTMVIMLSRSYDIIRCCGQSVTCGVENVTASCSCFRVVKLFVSH